MRRLTNLNDKMLVDVKNLVKLFPFRRTLRELITRKKTRFLPAVDGVSFCIARKEILGLAGESGCGKTTTGKLLALLEVPTEGSITFNSTRITDLKGHRLKALRKKISMIFQDPYDSLDPRYTVFDTIYEPLAIHNIGSKNERNEIVHKTLEHAELKPPEDYLDKRPHQLSGGQRQRVVIARAMVLRPQLVVADEPVSMLDVSIRSGIMKLMLEFKKEHNLSYLFITHDLSVARYMSDRLAIMYLGKIVEIGPTGMLISNPLHPYTKILLSSVPSIDPTANRQRTQIKMIDEALVTYEGCRFSTRCPCARNTCKQEKPKLREVENKHFVACCYAT